MAQKWFIFTEELPQNHLGKPFDPSPLFGNAQISTGFLWVELPDWVWPFCVSKSLEQDQTHLKKFPFLGKDYDHGRLFYPDQEREDV